jgi:hypothetical protein
MTIVAWLKSKNISSHTVAALLISAAGLIVGDQQIRDFLVGALASHPKAASTIIALAGIILKYTRSSSSTGAAQNVLADAATPPVAVVVTPPANVTKEETK